MKFITASAIVLLASSGINAFVSPSKSVSSNARKFGVNKDLAMGTMADELGLPCTDIPAFPNLPASVHPGVVSGQAMMDLLADAKEKGEVLDPY